MYRIRPGERGASAASGRLQTDLDLYDLDDYYGAAADPLLTTASEQVGSYSGHHKCDNGVSICLLVTTLAGIGVLYFILFQRITMAGRRRKRSSSSAAPDPPKAWFQVDESPGPFDAVDVISSGT